MMEQRVLIWASGRDGPLTSKFLSEAGFNTLHTSSCEECCRELERGTGVLLAAEELLADPESGKLRSLLLRQPAWSDVPLIVIAGEEGRDRASRLVVDLTSVSVLHRPLSLDTLCSTVGSALRARRRQYEVRDLLEQRDEANRRREEFLAMLAHELRNPLAPLRTGLQLLRLTEAEERRERVRTMLERQVENLSRLVDDLLDVSRITRGKIRLQKQAVEVGDVLRHALDARLSQAAEKGIRLALDPGALREPAWVDADPTRLEQMIDNVLVNAIKFTQANGSVTAGVSREGGEAVIRVRDTGIGISPHMLGAVFELFAQSERGLDRTQGGLGIGLTVVRTLAELHGGSATAYSEGDGKGTEIVIRLPALANASPRERAAVTGDSDAAGGSHRVLIVEDNRDAAEMLAGLLRHHGHVVSIAYTGDAGLAAYERERPEAVICDIGLPGLDGFALARAVRNRDRSHECLLIALTGYGEPRERERGLRAGFHHYLVKPADPGSLTALLRTLDRTEAGVPATGKCPQADAQRDEPSAVT